MHRRKAVQIELVTPFPEYALPVAWQWVRPALHLLADDFAIRDIDGLFAAAKSIEGNGGKTWGVLRDGRLAGWLGFEPVNKVSGIGHAFFAPWALGRETTDTAVRMALGEIYSLGYEKVSCPVMAANRGIRGLLRRIGMREEGTLRSHTLCGGRPADLVLYGEVKAEFYGNHDGVGIAPGRTLEHTGGADRHEHEHGHIERIEHTDVLTDSIGAAGDDGGELVELHQQWAEPHPGDDQRDERDQLDVQGDRRPATAKSVKPRVRKLGSQRNGGTPNGSRKSGRSRRSAKPAPNSSAAAATTSAG